MKRFFPSSDSSDGEDLNRTIAPMLATPQSLMPEPQAAAPQCPLPQTHKPGQQGATSQRPQSLPCRSTSWAQRRSWRDDLPGLLDEERAQLASQRRQLVVHTLVSGMGSPEQVLNDLGFSIDGQVACEKKEHARVFFAQNHLAPTKHWFLDAETLVASGHAPCSMHHGDTCGRPKERPGILVAGFPCTPFSRMRHGVASEHTAERHTDFENMSLTVQYITRTRPRVFVLEHVLAFVGVAEGDGMPRTHNFAEDMCSNLRKLGYDVAWVLLSLDVWVQAKSRRVHLGSRRRLGRRLCAVGLLHGAPARGSAQGGATGPMVRLFVRSEHTRVRAHWPELEEPDPLAMSHTAEHGDAAPMLVATAQQWAQQSRQFRARLLRADQTFHDTRPWSDGLCPRMLMGLPRPITPRKWEVLDWGVLWAMDQTGADMDKSIDGLLCDPTQNPARTPWSFTLKRLCRHSRPYSYKHDRLLTPGELLDTYRWDRPCLDNLSNAECCWLCQPSRWPWLL